MKPWTGIALMPDADFIASVLPLFQEGAIDVLEWSFDTLDPTQKEPEWLSLLLQDYSVKGRLLGHGVRYSLLSGNWTNHQASWLKHLQQEVKRYKYRHITEHFGFMTSNDFHNGAPLPVPLTNNILALGQDRLKRLFQHAGVPIGVENLAFAFSTDQVKEQGAFLQKLIEPVNGFLILDLHNIWCQAINFEIDPQHIVALYPLHKVKEIHISGGSWSSVSSSGKRIRRDTHDESVPEEVFDLLRTTLPLCIHTEAVIFERMGSTLQTEAERSHFRADYRRIKHIVSEASHGTEPSETIEPISMEPRNLPSPLEDQTLYEQQQLVIRILSNSTDPEDAVIALNESLTLKTSDWNTIQWKKEMVETAMLLLKKWN